MRTSMDSEEPKLVRLHWAVRSLRELERRHAKTQDEIILAEANTTRRLVDRILRSLESEL